MKRVSWVLIVGCTLVGVSRVRAQFPTTNPIPGAIPQSDLRFRLEKVIQIPDFGNSPPRLELLTFVGEGGDLYVNDQHGALYRFSPGDARPAVVANFNSLIDDFRDGGQRGLRSFALHPGFEDPASIGYQKLYTAHSEQNNGGADHDSVVAEWTLNSSGRVDRNVPPREILRVEQPRGDHNIGRIGFDPNVIDTDPDWGNLYIAFGDGGNFRNDRGDETLNPNAQDTMARLGSLLRIDPATPDETAGLPFTVPADNPFVGNDDFLPEIWAYGFRNPHTFGWDIGGSGNLYIGDIGQSDIEEVNLGQAGANYGWSEREGTFSVAGKEPLSSQPIAVDELPANHPNDGFTYPVVQYDHSPNDARNQIGNAAIAGGYVYRSDRLPALEGKYFFADFANNSGPIWIVDEAQLDQQEDFSNLAEHDGGYLAPVEELLLLDDNGNEATMLDILRASTGNRSLRRTDIRFGQGGDGEVYILNKHDGWIRRFASAVPGDCNGDGMLSADDLNCACADLDPVLDSLGLLRGDLDGNSEVGFADFLTLSANFGNKGEGVRYVDGDLDCNGQVEFGDFLTLSGNFGKSAAETVSVPEPRLAYMFWLGTLSLLSTLRASRRDQSF